MKKVTRKHLSYLLLLLSFLLFIIGACKKPKGGNDDDNIAPMYGGVKTFFYKK